MKTIETNRNEDKEKLHYHYLKFSTKSRDYAQYSWFVVGPDKHV